MSNITKWLLHDMLEALSQHVTYTGSVKKATKQKTGGWWAGWQWRRKWPFSVDTLAH